MNGTTMQYPVSTAKDIKIILGGTKYAREWNLYERKNRLTYLLHDINKRIDWGLIDDSYINISHGVLWAVGTGRITAFCVVGWLQTCTINDMLNLLEELQANCRTVMEVKDYLNTIQIFYEGKYDKDMYPIYKRIKSSKKGAEQGR